MDSAILHYKGKLKEVDYNQRLKLIYEWVKKGSIGQKYFIELVNYSIDLDLIPNEE